MIYAALEFSFRPRGKIPLAERGESVEHPSTNSTSLALLQVFAWAGCAQVESHPSDVMTLSSARGLSLSRRLCHGEPVMCVCVCVCYVTICLAATITRSRGIDGPPAIRTGISHVWI